MKVKFNLIVFLLVLTSVSCKKETTFEDYKFLSRGVVIDCDNENLAEIVNEALFSFENDITEFYSKNGQPNMNLAYSQFVRNAISGRVKYTDIASPHTVKVFEALKKENSLWDATNTKTYLNYNSSFFSCIANKIQNKNLRTTLNALLSTNSMSPKLFGAPLMSNYRSATSDKYLAGYIAFDLYYAKLFNIDLSKVEEKPEQKPDFNQTPKQPIPDPHAGHNH